MDAAAPGFGTPDSRSDRRNRARPVIGVLQRHLLGLYAEEWLGSVDGARALGCDLICLCGRALEEPGFHRLANRLYDFATEQALDGLIVWAQVLGANVGPERTQEYCRRFAGLPTVSVELPLGDAPMILMENREGMYAAVSHLIEVHGRRRILYLGGPPTHEGARLRYQGYLDALADHDLPLLPELVAPTPGGRVVTRPGEPPRWVLAKPWNVWIAEVLESERPDAVAAAHDDNAVWALSRLAIAGARVPEQIAVVGFDDSSAMPGHALDWNPNILAVDAVSDTGRDDQADARRAATISTLVNSMSLTTVRAPFHELGRRAVEAVLGLLRGETVPDVINVPTQLMVRRSCGCLPDAAHAEAPAMPDDWPDRLSAAFAAEMRDGTSGAFAGLLDQFAQLTLWSGGQVETCWQVLHGLRRLIGRPGASARETARGEELWLRAQMLLNEAAERHGHAARVLTERRNQIVREVGQRLIVASDLAEVADALVDELPKLGIPGCYLAVYEPAPPDKDGDGATPVLALTTEVDTKRSRLLLAYENGERVDLPADHAVFPSVSLVPGDRLRRAAPASFVTVSLYFKEQQLGFALLELGPSMGWVYATLQEQLSSAIHRVFMLERERLAIAALDEAHRAEERHRLAGELHDSVSQALFSMTLHTRAMQLAASEQGWDGQHRLVQGLSDLQELTQDALGEMRSLISNLRPEQPQRDGADEEADEPLQDPLRDGLVEGIRKHAGAVAAREGFEVRVQAPEERLPLTARAEEEIFRIVREALHNCVKHAHPSRVDIRLTEPAGGEGALLVEVADNGAGFDPGAHRPGHIGLSSMRERAARISGRLDIHSSPASGTVVRAVLPGILQRRSAADATANTDTRRDTRG